MGNKFTKPASVRWGDGDHEQAEVSSTIDLDALLERIPDSAIHDRPPIVDVEVPGQGSIRIGLGPRAVLSIMDESLDPPYFNSVGDEEDGPDLIFAYRGHWTDFPSRMSVPEEAAREAVRRFVSGELLPKNISWEET